VGREGGGRGEERGKVGSAAVLGNREDRTATKIYLRRVNLNFKRVSIRLTEKAKKV